ncbi:Bacterial alpha-L-rhamnosidase [Granulicella sp. WH15]|uniref:alpha-L-rhamnosidase n=1 Tax=Granulicella sp. WH15 TaxID=2602070 RepID=UPI001366FD4B|nr:alpha-L-rhamnosidase [Granulicella sp. WH15]QHN02996.1 Bacterial alpha-L-rhamnosidase [Granulicella sp. WH15]
MAWSGTAAVMALALAGMAGAGAATGHPGRVTELHCEGRETPLAVEEAHPRFSWTYGERTPLPHGTLEDEARVVVSHSAATAKAGKGEVWDSGWVKTNSLAMIYTGPALEQGSEYWWSVTTHNANGAPMTWSDPARFRIAEREWQGKWIQAPWSTIRDGAESDGGKPMPIFRREFALREKPVEAILRIAGLGQWEAQLDGSSTIAPSGLHQAWTSYRKTVTYSSYDLTAQLNAGHHALGVMLGNGMYNVQRSVMPNGKARYTKFEGSFGPPKMIAELRLRYSDGRTEVIASDTAWKAARGPVVFSSTYGGEDYDARKVQAGWSRAGFDDSSWAEVSIVAGPGGELRAEISPEMHEAQSYPPAKAKDLGPNTVLYDFGQNFSGRPRIRVQGPAGAVLKLTPSELLNPDGTPIQRSSGGPAWWTYTLKGTGVEEWEPQFDYYGFRYMQAEWSGTGAHIVNISAKRLTSDSPDTGTFASSSPMLNAIHKLIVSAMHNNEASLFTDCPHREKLGWLEETHLVAAGLNFNNNLEALFQATDKNMADAQRTDGMVPEIAPQYMVFDPKWDIFNDSPEWGSAAVLAPWAAYRFYGDARELARSYPTMQAYVKYLESKAHDGVVDYGLGDWYDIGPGNPGVSKLTTTGVTGTLMLYEDAVVMRKIASLLGHNEDAAAYTALSERTKAAFNRRFWDDKAGFYDKGSQAANAMPLALGVVPEERRAQVLAHIVADIHAHDDHVTTGEVSYPYLLRALMAAGRGDLLLTMTLRKDAPSYGSQLAAGATALTEAWDANPHASQDHFMLGAVEEWFYRGLGGIDIDMSRPDPAERITIRPDMVAGLNWINSSYKSTVGKIASSWKREGGITRMEVTIPTGVEATVVVPARKGEFVTASRTAKLLRKDGEARVYRLGSGTSTFSIRGAKA